MTLLYDEKKSTKDAPIETQEEVTEPQKPAELTQQQKWVKQAKEIRDSLSIEDLLFNNSVSYECKMYSGKLTVNFDSLNFNIVDEILNEVYRDSSGELTMSLESKHGLLLAAESIQAINGEILESDRHKKVEKIRAMNHNISMKLVDKYNQFDAAVKMLIQDEDDETLGDKLKK